MKTLPPRRYATLIFAFLVMLILYGCEEHHKYKVGISQCSSDDWRNKMNEEILREAMFHDDIEVEIRSAEDSNEKQIADLEYFVKNGFDLIAVAPNEAKPLTPKVKEIYESGIPVIVFDRTINGDTYTAYQGADNEDIGRMAALFAKSLETNPRVLQIKGLKDSSPAEHRHDGFAAVADSLQIEVEAEAYGDWNYENAYAVTDSLLDIYQDINVIYSHNDRMAIGASDAAKAHGRNDIKIIGVDAAPEIGIKAVADGKIDASFLYPTGGHQLVRTALSILKGEPYEKYLILPSSAPVDATNAEFLLLQDKSMKEETSKVGELQKKVSVFSERFSAQTNILYTTMVIILLLAILVFVLLRFYWTGKKHHAQMEARAQELARQRDELDKLYQQLQEATGSKLTFFTNVSHDLRTPLTLIADPINQLAEADNLTPQQRTLMQLAAKNAKRLQRLINQILDIRKYDNGQLKLSLVNVDLAAAMREWTVPFAEISKKRHIRFTTDIPSDTKVLTAIDVEKTERILFNLLSNAFKFTPENGQITVSLTSDNKNAVIKVADTGIGIPAEDLNNIFQRFFKTDKINPNGSGIGLALSKVFIDMHGGAIDVESNEGKGSIFTVRLPIRQADESVADTVKPAYTDMAEIDEVEIEEVEVSEDTPTVLVIDDNKDICTLLKSVLSDRYTVITAYSGAQGIRLASKYVPDLIICDVMMPGTSGYEVCAVMKKEPLTSHIPVLLLTACSRDEQRTEGYACGADAYMSKPFDTKMLLARCKSLIDNRKLIYDNRDLKSVSVDRPANDKVLEVRPQPVEDEFLVRFMDVVEKEMGNSELSVESIAETLGISRVQLYRKIKALTNYSAVEMIRNIRLKRAATMLKTSACTVSEVAYTVGFSSPGYFSKCYKEYFGETPVDTQSRTSKAKDH